jgi:hypothetical protein
MDDERLTMTRISAQKRRLGPSLSLFALFFAGFVTNTGHGRAQGKFWVEDVRSTQHYRMGSLDRYSFVYVDRDFIFTELPTCLTNKPYVITANLDKFNVDSAFLTIGSSEPAYVYVGFDRRYQTIPNWLRRFDRVSELELVMGDKSGRTEVVLEVYRSFYPAGKIQLGGNMPPNEKGNYAMYTVVLAEESVESCP